MKGIEENAAATIEAKFVAVANELNCWFPDLDLRFNLKTGSTRLRLIIPELSEEALELELNARDTTELVREAILLVKELGRLFDA